MIGILANLPMIFTALPPKTFIPSLPAPLLRPRPNTLLTTFFDLPATCPPNLFLAAAPPNRLANAFLAALDAVLVFVNFLALLTLLPPLILLDTLAGPFLGIIFFMTLILLKTRNAAKAASINGTLF